jgi:hypothetical protein
MKSKTSQGTNLPDTPILVPSHKNKITMVPKTLLPAVSPAKYKGWSCKLFVVWMHCQN